MAILSMDASEGFAAVAAGVAPEAVTAAHHPAVAAILNQHAWNLLWLGIVTTVGGLEDLGYLILVDFGGYATFISGRLIAGSAIVLGGWVFLSQRETRA